MMSFITTNWEYLLLALYVVEKVIKLKLTAIEKKQFNNSVKAVRKLTNLALKLS